MVITKLNRCKKLHDDRAKAVTQPTHYPFTPGNNTRIRTKIQGQAPLGDSIAKLYQDGSYPPQMTLPACSKEVTQRKEPDKPRSLQDRIPRRSYPAIEAPYLLHSLAAFLLLRLAYVPPLYFDVVSFIILFRRRV